jgi:ABC-type Fe3+/spermidine/putrescine transport system ATPase subunit
MNDARIEQVGTPHEVYRRPQTAFVAAFLGESNLIDGVIEAIDGDKAVVATAAGRTSGADLPRPVSAGSRVKLLVRPEAVRIAPPASTGAVAKLVSHIFVGDGTRCYFDLAGTTIVAKLGNGEVMPSLETGASMTLTWSGSDTVAVPAG